MTSLAGPLRLLTVTFALAMLTVAAASAQTKGRVAVGASVTAVLPTDNDVHRTAALGFQARLVARKGWGAGVGLNWFTTDVDGTAVGVTSTIGRIRVRPLMGGVGYNWIFGPTAVTASVVAGPSYNKLLVSNPGIQIVGSSTDITLAVRPAVSLTYALLPRLALTTSAGYLFNRPRFTLHSSAGDARSTWKTDAVVLSVGMVYSLF